MVILLNIDDTAMQLETVEKCTSAHRRHSLGSFSRTRIFAAGTESYSILSWIF